MYTIRVHTTVYHVKRSVLQTMLTHYDIVPLREALSKCPVDTVRTFVALCTFNASLGLEHTLGLSELLRSLHVSDATLEDWILWSASDEQARDVLTTLQALVLERRPDRTMWYCFGLYWSSMVLLVVCYYNVFLDKFNLFLDHL